MKNLRELASVLRTAVWQMVVVGLLALAVSSARATERYVSDTGTNDVVGGYTTWSGAATSIQAALHRCSASDTVTVQNAFVCNTGGLTNWPAGSLLTNRVVITNSITLRSADPAGAPPVIVGAWDPVTTGGAAAVRGVYMTANTKLLGFTVTNGATLAANTVDGKGAGIYAADTTPVISNCLITGNAAGYYGGGGHNGTYYRSTFIGNRTLDFFNYPYGGGLYAGAAYACQFIKNVCGKLTGATSSGGAGGGASAANLYNCLLVGNVAAFSGGYYAAAPATYRAYNCTMVGNQAISSWGGGVFGGIHFNCIIYSNSPNNFATPGNSVYFTNCCTDPTNVYWDVSDITNNPAFVDWGSGYGTNMVIGDYHLRTNSPCLNAGTNGSWTASGAGARDLDGQSRVQMDVVDMGAYERPPRSGPLIANSDAVVEASQVTLNGYLVDTGLDANVSAAVFWGPNDGGTNMTGWAYTNLFPGWSAIGPLSTTVIPGLAGARYYYRFFASNSLDYAWASSSGDFATLGAPSVNNAGGAISVTLTAATLQGEVTGGNPTPMVWIYWGTVDRGTDKSLWEHVEAIGPASNWTFSATVALSGAPSYHYTCYASNLYGDAWSSVTSFDGKGIHYVNKDNPSPQAPFTNGWASAATNIQDAINVAAREFVLVTNGTYYLTNTLFITNGVTLRSYNNGSVDVAGTVINGNWPAVTNRCLYMTNGVVEGFTITNGWAVSAGSPYGGYGGGVYLRSGGTVTNCTIAGNWADIAGGGLYLYNGGLVTTCGIEGNLATNLTRTGGGVHIYYVGVVSNCTIRGNNSHFGAGAYIAGGSATVGDGLLVNCTVIQNTAAINAAGEGGAGVYSLFKGLIQGCTIVSNAIVTNVAVSGYAAGAQLGDGATMRDCVVMYNTGANYGQGIQAGANRVVSNCVIRNHSNHGVYLAGSGLLVNCTIVSNAQGVWAQGGTVRNSLLAYNTTEAGYAQTGPTYYQNCTVVNNGCGFKNSGATVTNLVENSIVYFNGGTGTTNYTATGVYIWTNSCTTPMPSGPADTGNIASDPRLPNRGAGDFRLSGASPCVDKGVYRDWMAGAVDLEGMPRIQPKDGGVVDMGAYESTPSRGTVFNLR